VIVHDFYVVAVTVAPDKADAPLVVDPDRVLTLSLSSQGLQSIARRRSQDSQLSRGVKLQQFAQGHSFDGTEALAVMIVKEILGLPREKASDHTFNV
jgi:hypothetical protein